MGCVCVCTYMYVHRDEETLSEVPNLKGPGGEGLLTGQMPERPCGAVNGALGPGLPHRAAMGKVRLGRTTQDWTKADSDGLICH